MNPVVSVVIPTRNRCTLLEETIKSVLLQDYQEKEIVVVDDGSSDDTESCCIRLGVRYLYQDQLGCAAARNLGAAHARGVLIAFLDDDDLWPLGSLSARVREWQRDPGCAHIIGRTRRFSRKEGEAIMFLEPESDAYHMLGLLGAGVMLKSAFDSLGGFDESLCNNDDVYLRSTEDTDLWFRMQCAGMKLRKVDEICLHYRRHPGNVSGHLDDVEGQHRSLLHSLHWKLSKSKTGVLHAS
jgi:glycosyltransferase involved in cell wall biosynthesis